MRKKIFAGLFPVLFGITACSGPGIAPENTNVILCMADDMGWGDVAYNGHPEIHTPFLDEMAASGVRFDRFYAGASVCSPTRGSCLTGRNPFRYGIYTANRGYLKQEEINLAEVFKDQGYTTGHFGKWHLGTMSPEFSGKGPSRHPERNYMTPGMAGFDEWFSTEFAVATYDPYNKKNAHSKYWKNEDDRRALYWLNGEPLQEDIKGCDSEAIMDRAIDFIRESVSEEKKFFTVIWFHAPHAPVVGHPEYMKNLYSDLPEEYQHYYSVITALDAQVGRLRETLKELGVAENTMLCFTSDNGPEGNPGPKGKSMGSAGHLRGRKRAIYEGGIRVPGIIEFPALTRGSGVVSAPAVTSDYFPTCCEILGIDISEFSRPYDGISLIPFLTGDKKLRENPIGFNGLRDEQALIDDRYKLFFNPEGVRHRWDNSEQPLSEYELYDILEDPSETSNLVEDFPEIFEEMKSRLEDFTTSCANSDRGEDYPERQN